MHSLRRVVRVFAAGKITAARNRRKRQEMEQQADDAGNQVNVGEGSEDGWEAGDPEPAEELPEDVPLPPNPTGSQERGDRARVSM